MRQHVTLIAAYRDGDVTARERLITENTGLVSSWARWYHDKNLHIPYLDLYQEGIVGLIRSIESFDCSKKIQFSTYAMYWIRKYIQRYVAMNHTSGASSSITSANKYLSGNMDADDMVMYHLRCVNTRHNSLDFSMQERTQAPVDEQVIARSQSDALAAALDNLPLLHSTCISLSYGLGGEHPLTTVAIAQITGVNRSVVVEMIEEGIEMLEGIMNGQAE